ncbi:MAG: aminoglycoside phosphotransferase family protein [Deltaproteobacteria bacterium]
MAHVSVKLPTLDASDAAAIVREPVHSVTPIGQGLRSRVYRVETDEGLVRIVRLTSRETGRIPREAWVRSQLKRHPDVPLVAEVSVTDVPLAREVDIVTMTELPGTTMYQATRTLFEPEVCALYEQFGAGLGALHAVPTRGFGLIDGAGHGAFPTWRTAFDALAHAALEEARMAALQDLVPTAKAVIARLSDDLDVITDAALLHGDAQPMNVQAHRGRIVAFLDFEFASGGDTEYELAYVEPLFEPGTTHGVAPEVLAARRAAFYRGYAKHRARMEPRPERVRLYRLVHALRGTEFLSVVGPRLAAPQRDEHVQTARAQLQRWIRA